MNEIRNRVLLQLEQNFTSEQLQMIDLAVAKAMQGYKIEQEETLPAVMRSTVPVEIKEFLIRKDLKGCSSGTHKLYESTLTDFAYRIRKNIREATDVDILAFLDYRIRSCGVAARTAEGNRLILSSFFTFMHETGKMNYNPSRTVDPVKHKKTVRKPLSDIELEHVRNSCQTFRERAIFETLYSTGARVSELEKLNWADVDFKNRCAIVVGKGNKERYIFFNAKALVAIENYLKIRTDNNAALFVCSRFPYNRLKKGSLETEIKRIGERSGIGRDVFPHLLRHTFATDMLYHGAKLDEVSEMLGHKSVETTKIYAKTNKEEMKSSHKKYVA